MGLLSLPVACVGLYTLAIDCSTILPSDDHAYRRQGYVLSLLGITVLYFVN